MRHSRNSSFLFPLGILLASILFLFTSCSQDVNRDYGDQDFPQFFQQQISNHCAPGNQYRKVVTTDTEQSKVLKVEICPQPKKEGKAILEGKTISFSLQQDLSYAFKYFYLDPFIAEYYTVTETENGEIQAVIQPDFSKKSDLKKQVIRRDQTTPTLLRYVESEVETTSMFFYQQVITKVEFDSTGIFTLADIYLYNKLKMTGKELTTHILIYPEKAS